MPAFECRQLRKTVLRMAHAGSTVHIGCAFSIVEILAVLYRSHLRMARDNGDEAVDLGAADRRGDVGVGDEDAALRIELDRVLRSEPAESFAVAELEPLPLREPGERPVHRPGVEVAEAETLGEPAGDGALARAGRPVDRDDHLPSALRPESRGRLSRGGSLMGRHLPHYSVVSRTATRPSNS